MMRFHKQTALVFLLVVPLTASAAEFASDFANTYDRIWVGKQYWANPMEDWRIQDGRLECLSDGPNRNVHVLTHTLSAVRAPFTVSVKVDLLAKGKNTGSAGFRLGARDEIDDYRAAALRGKGLDCGVTSQGELFLMRRRQQVDSMPDSAVLQLTATPGDDDSYAIVLRLNDAETGKQRAAITAGNVPAERLVGSLALVNNHPSIVGPRKGSAARFAFSNWTIKGAKIACHPDRAFGPILWAMHTLSNSRGADGHVLKLTAQMPPLGKRSSASVTLQAKRDGTWQLIGVAKIDPDARTATFRVAHWPADQDVPYRLLYKTNTKSGTLRDEYTGTVRHDPVDRTLVVAAFTGNADTVFPNLQTVHNVTVRNPDLLFFSGDQIYETVGGYGIVREPADRAILNYLRKWYLFGWSFGPLMRDRVTVCLPDDHDVFQGNLWGDGGRKITREEWQSKVRGAAVVGGMGGYVEPAEMVNVVHRTQCSHHPDLFDPKPIKQGISVYFGDMVYGRVSFAIIGDREFKSGPMEVATWPGRADHVKDPNFDVAKLDKPGLKLLGNRQLHFLDLWARDWRGCDLKVVLSETIFCNLANYHGGNQQFIYGDLDSNGWPQTGRNRALAMMRRGFAFHIAGDQHLASITRNGIEEFNDAGYAFCVPSIANFYPRSWLPDKEGRAVRNRPKNGAPNTGEYLDGLHNKITVYAVANPADHYRHGRLLSANDKSSGYAIVRLDQTSQSITMECYRLLSDAAHPAAKDQFTGWPMTIRMLDNYARKPVAWLPTLKITGLINPVIQVRAEQGGEILYALRVHASEFRPMVFAPGKYTIQVGEPDQHVWKTLPGIEASTEPRELNVDF